MAIVPRFIVRKFFPDEAHQIHANVLVTSILLVLLFALWQNCHVRLAALALPGFCICQKVLHIPCPGCGVTRSVSAAAGGDISTAWTFNPAGVLLFLYLLAQIPLRIVALKCDVWRAPVARMARMGSRLVIFVLFLVWILRSTQ